MDQPSSLFSRSTCQGTVSVLNRGPFVGTGLIRLPATAALNKRPASSDGALAAGRYKTDLYAFVDGRGDSSEHSKRMPRVVGIL